MMDQTQYYRWLDFATRMARTYPNRTAARRAKIEHEVTRFIDLTPWNWDMGDVDCWDGGPAYVCDEISNYLSDNGYLAYEERFDRHGNVKGERFADEVTCCVRAGFDLAVAPSAGVVGFDVGLLRRMYEGNLPDWITNWFDPPLTADVPDDVGAWL